MNQFKIPDLYSTSARNPEFSQFPQHLVHTPLLASVHRIEEMVPVFNPNREQNLGTSA